MCYLSATSFYWLVCDCSLFAGVGKWLEMTHFMTVLHEEEGLESIYLAMTIIFWHGGCRSRILKWLEQKTVAKVFVVWWMTQVLSCMYERGCSTSLSSIIHHLFWAVVLIEVLGLGRAGGCQDGNPSYLRDSPTSPPSQCRHSDDRIKRSRERKLCLLKMRAWGQDLFIDNRFITSCMEKLAPLMGVP